MYSSFMSNILRA